MSEINQRLWPVQAVVAYDKLKDELNEAEIALARIFSDAGRLTEERDKLEAENARLTEERDRLFQDLLAAHPFYYREWEKAKAENARLSAAFEACVNRECYYCSVEREALK